jgi:hypothetical protein
MESHPTRPFLCSQVMVDSGYGETCLVFMR